MPTADGLKGNKLVKVNIVCGSGVSIWYSKVGSEIFKYNIYNLEM